jgi:hypothetical protein
MRISRGPRWLAWLAPLGFLVPVGCSNHPGSPPQVSQSAKDTRAAVTQPPADAVAVKLVKYEGMQDAIKQLKGKVVVVDVWADW